MMRPLCGKLSSNPRVLSVVYVLWEVSIAIIFIILAITCFASANRCRTKVASAIIIAMVVSVHIHMALGSPGESFLGHFLGPLCGDRLSGPLALPDGG